MTATTKDDDGRSCVYTCIRYVRSDNHDAGLWKTACSFYFLRSLSLRVFFVFFCSDLPVYVILPISRQPSGKLLTANNPYSVPGTLGGFCYYYFMDSEHNVPCILVVLKQFFFILFLFTRLTCAIILFRFVVEKPDLTNQREKD